MQYTLPQYSSLGGKTQSCQFTSTNVQIVDQSLKNECVFQIPTSIHRNAPIANRTIPANAYRPLQHFGEVITEAQVPQTAVVRVVFVEGDNIFQTGGLI